MKILVAYASSYGATKGIADSIGERLRQQGLQADVSAVDSVEEIRGYDAFVVGSALYMFHWMKEARKFVSKNKEVLSSHPTWLFSSGPVGTKATDAKGNDVLKVSGPKELEELLAFTGAREHRVFFGALDGSKLKGMTGAFYRMARRSEEARESMPEGDFRDWKLIEAWADEIAAELKAPLQA